jgi:hypothetical protein
MSETLKVVMERSGRRVAVLKTDSYINNSGQAIARRLHPVGEHGAAAGHQKTKIVNSIGISILRSSRRSSIRAGASRSAT